jgi:hypothetical protein
MTRWRCVGLGLLFTSTIGCFGPFADDARRKAHKKIATPELAAASTEAAVRVDRLGRKLLAASPFLLEGEPTLQTVGLPEPELFHRDSTGLFITEGAVKLCQNDDELAALLAHELGHMAAEARRAERMKLPDSIPASALPRSVDGSTTPDAGRVIDLADLEMHYRRPAEKRLWASTDPAKIARDCLQDAGYDPKLLKSIEPILRQTRRHDQLARQFNR